MYDIRIEWIWDMLNKKEMRFQMWLYVYTCIKVCLQNHWTILFPSRYNDTYDMRWEAFGTRLNTHRGFGPCVWALLPFRGHMHAVWWLQRYRWYGWDMMIQMRWEAFRARMSTHKGFGCVLGRLIIWGSNYACTYTMRYEITPRLINGSSFNSRITIFTEFRREWFSS